MERFIYLREREKKESGHTLRDLRHRYLAHLETYVTRITNEESTESDIEVLREEFRNSVKDDLRSLNQELWGKVREAVFSKEMFVTAMAGVGTVAAAAAGTAFPALGTLTWGTASAAAAGGAAVADRYFSARRIVMQNHPMAYLYTAQTI